VSVITYAQAEAHAAEIERRARGSAEHRLLGDGTRRLAYAARDAAVYRALYSHAHRKTGACWPSARTIAARLECSPTTVTNAARRLAAGGYLTIRRWVQRTPYGLRWYQRYEFHAERIERSPEDKGEIIEGRAPALLRAETKERLAAEATTRLEARAAAMMGMASAGCSMRPHFGPNQREIDLLRPNQRPTCERPQPSRYLEFWHRALPLRPGLHVTGRIVVKTASRMTPEQQIEVLMASKDRLLR